MTSKERLLLAINLQQPDRVPASVHQGLGYHLKKYLGGMDQLDAFANRSERQRADDGQLFTLVEREFQHRPAVFGVAIDNGVHHAGNFSHAHVQSF